MNSDHSDADTYHKTFQFVIVLYTETIIFLKTVSSDSICNVYISLF